ncbi:hypothetical protein JXA88_17330 [Candidatus Fermentibacteria bacterium]|nr:hypothetical protein [Candidatus Fermentibacteria bacterium]
MSGLAGLFVQAGWEVSGCDSAHVRPPAADTLAGLGITPSVGYSADHLRPAPDLVIVGNVIRESNPEDHAARALGLPRTHMAAALRDFFIRERTSIVVAGTHGKTTSTSMLAFLLCDCGMNPGFFIGGVARDLGTSFRRGQEPYFVTEGDEYDCAWFDKSPKFLHYGPRYLLITNVEFDHADIYADLDAVRAAFRRLVQSMPSDGRLVYCAESPALVDVARDAPCEAHSYSVEPSVPATWIARGIRREGTRTRFNLSFDGIPMGEFSLRLAGRHNVQNATGVIALWHAMGLPLEDLARRLPRFRGAARRMQVLTCGDLVLVDDFAHHPTEVRATLAAARQWWPSRRLWAVFEPKTQTSRRAVLQDDLASALALSDEVVIIRPHDLDTIPLRERIDAGRLADAIRAQGIQVRIASTHDQCASIVQQGVGRETLVVLMSAGSLADVAHTLTSYATAQGLATTLEPDAPLCADQDHR